MEINKWYLVILVLDILLVLLLWVNTDFWFAIYGGIIYFTFAYIAINEIFRTK